MFSRILATSILIFWGGVACADAAIEVVSPNCPEIICGTGVSVYIDGELGGNEAERLEALVAEGTVTPYSTVYFNSPGGSLFGGMELARAIRKHGFNTGVSRRNEIGQPTVGGAICMSACSLAYLGGVFRYFQDDDFFGVHRFYSNEPLENETEIAQVASAAIVSFLTEMGVASDFFVEMTRAGSQSMRMLNLSEMLRLGVANNGIGPTSWTVTAPDSDARASFLYLKGERDTSFGINKLIFHCGPRGSGLFMHVIFDPQGRTDEARSMRAISLEIDGEDYPFTQFLIGDPKIVNGWLNATFELPAKFWAAIKKADEIGMKFQFSYQAPVFLGIANMSLTGSKKLMAGIESSCAYPKAEPLAHTYRRYQDTDFFGADLTQTGFKGITLAKCEAICTSTNRCRAYTYVQKSQWCFPKSGVGRWSTKPGMISGHK